MGPEGLVFLPYPLTEEKMKLQAPKQITFWIAVILAVLGLLGQLVVIPVVSGVAFWLVLAAFVLLLLGVLLDGI